MVLVIVLLFIQQDLKNADCMTWYTAVNMSTNCTTRFCNVALSTCAHTAWKQVIYNSIHNKHGWWQIQELYIMSYSAGDQLYIKLCLPVN
jgi:hypothetical protein